MAEKDARDPERGSPEQGASPAPVPSRRRGLERLRRRRVVRTEGEYGDHPAYADRDESAAVAPGEPSTRERGKVRAFMGVVADRLIALTPRIPVRDLATLRTQFPGLGPEEIADKLVAGAAHGSAAVGAGVGAAAMMPVPPAMPTELAAEIVGVASVELKLIAELHEVYGRRPPGNARERSMAYLRAWSAERGIDPTRPTTVNAALGGQLRRELRQRLVKRTVRNLPSLTPFMIGAAVGAVMNRRDTRKLASRMREDLRRVQVAWDALPPADGEAGSPPALPPSGD